MSLHNHLLRADLGDLLETLSVRLQTLDKFAMNSRWILKPAHVFHFLDDLLLVIWLVDELPLCVCWHKLALIQLELLKWVLNRNRVIVGSSILSWFWIGACARDNASID